MNLSPYSITPDDLKPVLEKFALEALQKNFQEISLLITCKGYLGGLESSAYKKHYKVSLTHNETIFLDIPTRLVESLNLVNGLYVAATGYLIANIFQSTLDFRLNVTQIEVIDSPEKIQKQRREKAELEQLGSVATARHLFPKVSPCTLGLIFPKANQAQVKQDFLNALLSDHVKNHFIITDYPVNILSPEEIAQAIKNSREDILVIIRGGGDAAQFETFNKKIVLEALGNHAGYRVCGIGHTAQFTLLDRIADYSANTPTAAGYHINKQFFEIASLYYEINSIQKSRKRWRLIAKVLTWILLAVIIAGAGYHLYANHNQDAPAPVKLKPATKHHSTNHINRVHH